ncbi:Hypothetical predicted protein [Pelobates cultripes]|uniref:Uncharacterized protein n=1 Tax=Pelobates cultripes TaxID=61616 RepID=A0AAD1SZJ7_PELCU|nr:Hypothetical predicted protein [Pelobates cultripes]
MGRCAFPAPHPHWTLPDQLELTDLSLLGQKLPSIYQRLWDQAAQRRSLLGEQHSTERVRCLQSLVERELILDNIYRELWWHAIQQDVWLSEGASPEGKDYGGLGLVWRALEEDNDFGSPTQSRYWAIYAHRNAVLQYPSLQGLGPDLARLSAMELEIKRDYVELLNAVQSPGSGAEQEIWMTSPDLPPYSWEDPEGDRGECIHYQLKK